MNIKINLIVFIILLAVTETNGPSDNDNESSYIAGLSFLIIINISLVVAFLFFVR